MSEKTKYAIVIKAAGLDEPNRLVFGYALVSKIGGADGPDYHDTQGDHVNEDEVLKAGLDFARNSMSVNDMHDGGPDVGRSYFVFPMTGAIAKSLGMAWAPEAAQAQQGPGLLIGAQVSPEEFARVQRGERVGFSIEGTANRDAVEGT